MGKLTIKVQKCQLYRPAVNGGSSINPRVTVIVDGTYRFQTRVKKDTFEPHYHESFFVGSTHRLAVIEISVYDVQEPIGLALPGIGIVTAARGVVRTQNCTMMDDSDQASAMNNGVMGAGASAGAGGSSSGSTPPVLLGRCYIATQRLVHDQRKRRTFHLGTPLGPLTSASLDDSETSMSAGEKRGNPPHKPGEQEGSSLLGQSLPPGIAGTVTISLESDTLGDPPNRLRLDEALEEQNVRGLRRFFLCYDKPKVQLLDVLMSHVRNPSELVENDGLNSVKNSLAPPKTGEKQKATSSTPRPSIRNGSLTSYTHSRVSSTANAAAANEDTLEPMPLSVHRDGLHEATAAANNGGDKNVTDSAGNSMARTSAPRKLVMRQLCIGGRAELTVDVPDKFETFEELMARLCAHYRAAEPGDFRMVMRVDGCTNLDKDLWNKSFIGSDDVYVVLRSEAEQFASEMVTLRNTVVWTEANTITLDVVNPHRFYVLLILMGCGGGKTYEIGRCCVSAAPLSQGHVSRRDMFLCTGEGITRMATNGVAHLLARPVNFGFTPVDMAESVDDFYERLNRFFVRYDPLRLPEVDMLVKARLSEQETFMQELVVQYGREPGTVRLLIAVEFLISLRESAEMDLDEKEVRLLISMGFSTVRTKSMLVSQFAPTKVKEKYMFDVVRETDLIRIEVVNARREDVIYGRVDFSCLNTQRGVMNQRDLYLVGAAGTPDAYFSGIVRLKLYSDDVGHTYEVDTALEDSYAGRLRRYVHRRVPESLHRVNLAVATVFDMESFMAQMSLQYGDEDPTYALYFTVVGCRDLRSGIGGVNPYVVVRLGIDAYQTKTVKSSVEPDYFEFCEFYYDRPGDMVLTLVVMDQSDIGRDEELGRVAIPLIDVQPSKQYNDWLPLLLEKKNGKVKEMGTIGFKYTVVDLNLVDQTRLRLLKRHALRTDMEVPVVMEGLRGNRTSTLSSVGGTSRADVTSNAAATIKPGTPHPVSSTGQRWSNFKKYFQLAPLTGRTLRTVSSANAGASDVKGSSNGNEETTHVVKDQDTVSFNSTKSGVQRMPTLNLMDGGIHSVEEFCSADDSLLNSNMASETEADLSASMDFATDEGAEQMNTSVLPVDANESPNDVRGPSKMQLRVRLLSCTNLLKLTRNPPNPYVLLSTTCESHRSRVQFDTTEPRFNETFKFRVENPNTDFLSITVLTETLYGSKKLGHCTLSMRNVQRGAMRTRWTSLVVHPFKPNATEYGAIYLSLGAINFGMNYLPSMDAENRLREKLREYLTLHARPQLHRLEWYVGEFSQMESVLLGGWLHDGGSASGNLHGGVGHRMALGGRSGGAADSHMQAAELEVSVYGISHLYANGFLSEGSVVVKARVNGRTQAKTKPLAGTQGSFVFPEGQEPLRFTVDQPATALVEISVILNGKISVGDCFVSLEDLHRGVAKERTLMLVKDSKSSRAEPIGLVTLGVLSDNFGSSAPPPTAEDLALHSRLTRFCYFYLPTELVMVDVKYATTLNVAAYLNRMVQKYGPEPGEFHLRFTLDRVRNMRLRRDGSRTHLFCILRVGLQEFQTSIVEGEAEFVFCESFDLMVGLPSREKVELIVMRYSPSKNIVVGRTAASLDDVERQEKNDLELALVDHSGTKAASVWGVLKVSVYPQDFGRERGAHLRTQSSSEFGIDGVPNLAQTTYLFMNSTTAMEATQRRYGSSRASPLMAPGRAGSEKQLDKGSSLSWQQMRRADDPLSREESLFMDRSISPAALKDGTSAFVTIVGFAGLTLKEAEVYLRVSEGDTVLLKTKPIPVEQLVALEPASATFKVENVAANYESTYTLKLGVRNLFVADAVCHADFCVTRCPANRTVEKRLRLYDESGRFLGICRISVNMPKVHLPVQQWRHLSPSVFEPLMDDVASLLATYTPKDLRRLDVLLCRSRDIRELHRSLRLQLAPSVVATIYVAVHKIDFHSATLRHTCVVAATVGRFTCEAERRPPGASPVYPYGMSREGIAKLDFPLLRVDISETGPAALLTLSVSDRASKSKVEELGRTVVSLRALLTPAVFTMSEKVQVPLVSVRHASNRVHAVLIGTITFSILPPSFESYSSVVRFPTRVVEGFDRAYVRYYIRRISRLLNHYDDNSLVDIHARMYETYVSNRGWESGLPAYLADMVARWGPEVDECEPPPPISRGMNAAEEPPADAEDTANEASRPKELTATTASRLLE
ncbi:putative C2 domain protein [Leptomonas pyrrhocoris]|uniref:Putative C2 domain protein n=1 Tax=Leptomonas pyrrhocoris TaxID=157538 RepID=A0A0N0DWF0_LEPPY|nr:putative C2 domain protein [Leptomonas pyrrhocoris]KPA81481.1 putative C2 domain protein [Leptomonas pyrrhocoris]|eukprot:XP_015659920.1 putative C2 domain protein [Leptomonas pyrrhocoris]